MENLIDVLKVLIVSALPVLELRVGLPLAILLGFSKRWAFFYSVLGNTLGLFTAFYVLDHMMPKLKKFKIIQQVYVSSTKRVMRSRSRHQRLKYLGLFFLVAIPFPGTGAWTAALVSYLFGFERHRTLLVTFAGIVAVALAILFVGVITIHGYRKVF